MIADDDRVWYHVTLSTNGSWLYGGKRGFRTRHHREYIDGDYKHPPSSGKYDNQERRSKDALKQSPVVLPDICKRATGWLLGSD
jgi:hypothetical protein